MTTKVCVGCGAALLAAAAPHIKTLKDENKKLKDEIKTLKDENTKLKIIMKRISLLVAEQELDALKQ